MAPREAQSILIEVFKTTSRLELKRGGSVLRCYPAAGLSPGGEVFMHGQPNDTVRCDDHPACDWTVGCVAVTNDEMREIWSLVATATPIVLYP